MRVRDAQKEKILQETVVQLIVQEGFDGLSMHKLARATHMSVSTIYVYFNSREDMLNQVYNSVAQHHAQALLQDFDPQMPFADGLWIQWRNRYRYIQQYPHYFQFMEQFRHSPLIHRPAIQKSHFIEVMTDFFNYAMQNGEIPDCEPDVLWSLAFGPLYALVKLGTNEIGIAHQPFSLSESLLQKTCTMVINALRHESASS